MMNKFTQTFADIFFSKFLLLLILVTFQGYSQNAIVGTGFSSGWGGGSCPTGNGNFKYLALVTGSGATGTYGVTTTANGTGDQFFRFGVDWSGTTAQLTRTIGSDDTVAPNTTYSLNTSCTTSGALKYNVPNASYNYVFKTLNAGTNPTGTFVFFEVQGAVRSVSSVSQSPVATNVGVGLPTTITANLDGALSSGQAVYLRYTTNNYTTSTVVQMTGSGATYTADIPGTANTAGANVSYYVFTSGTSGVNTDGTNADLYTINLNNNGGSNYSYISGTIVRNPITGTNPSTSNPYSAGQIVNTNVTSTGIGRGTGVSSGTANDRYNTSGWDSASLNANDFFQFVITPNANFRIDFNSLNITLQRSNTNIVGFALRSSIDNYTTTIGSATVTGTTATTSNISLTGASFQDVSSAITFRLYAWGGAAANTLSVNDYAFYGAVEAIPTAPEINIQGNGVSIVDGDTTPSLTDHTDFGSIATTTGSVVRTFTIQNTGTANLVLDATPVTLSATNGFSITQQPTSPVAPSGSTTFQITFDPTTAGTETVTVTVENNDSDEDPYTFDVTGLGIAPQPEINVQGNAVTIVDGDTSPSSADDTDFGSVNIGSGTIVKTFTIQNTGDTNLVLDSPAVLLNETDGFTITQQPTSPVAPSGSTTFEITFDPSLAGSDTNTVIIGSNDSDESVYSFDISGIGTISSPVATAATAVLPVGFTANWDAVAGATSYRLDVSTDPNFETLTNATDLIISEYVEGSSNNKYVEIYNGTGATIDLSNYELRLYANGATSPTNTNVLSGNLPNNSTVVYKNSAATIYAGAATNQTSMAFNGDDALALYKISSASFVDIFGRIGEDPGTAWTSGSFTTLDKTLVRNSNISSGVSATSGSSGFPTLASQWTQSNVDVVSNLGSHTYNAVSPNYVSGYENLNVGNVVSYQVTGLNPETTYYYRVRAFSGIASANSNTISVTTKPTTCTWNGTAWSNTTGPDADIEAIIAGVYSTAVNGEFTAKKVTVNSGSLTVNSGNSITIINDLVNNLTAAEVVFQNNANLIQSATINNTGSITVNRNSSLIRRLDYTLWSSPVAGQNLLSFSPQTLTNRFYTYNSTTNLYAAVDPATTSFTAANGYLIRVPNNHTTSFASIWAGQFVGVPHNGNYTVTMQDDVSGQRFNLVGNPYPSPIDAVDFVTSNSSSITGTLYFWRKTNNTASPSYCTWTTAGFVTNNEAQVFDPNDVIQTGQGFFVEATGTNDQLVFNNDMRVDNHANQFFRNAQTTTTVERNRIWLNASNTTGAFSQAMIGYMSDATNGFDARIDGKYINDGEIAFASLLNTEAMAIQGRTLPFDVADVVPMRFSATTAGSYSIAIDRVDGLFAEGQEVYLRDNLLGVTHNLGDGAYNFTSASGTFDARFEVVYQTTLSTDNPVLTANQVVVYPNGANALTIDAGTAIMNNVKIFDIRGRLLTESKNVNATQTTLTVSLTNEVLLVQITAENGATVTKKVVK
jgi:hypothetical protein